MRGASASGSLVCTPKDGMAPVEVFFRATCWAPALRSLYLQVMIELSILVERSLDLIAQDQVPNDRPIEGISADVISLEDFSAPAVREHRLLEYVEAGRIASKGVNRFFMATDKGNSGSLPLQLSFLTMPGNLGVALCPQALPVGPQRCSRIPELCVSCPPLFPWSPNRKIGQKKARQ